MFTLADFAPVPLEWRGGYLAIGNFDGVHVGHAGLLSQLRDRAAAAGSVPLVVTFNPHPGAFLRPESAPVPLTWSERKTLLLKEFGVAEVFVFQTGAWLLSLSARSFLDKVISQQFSARGLVEGANFGFGKDRKGNVELLREWCVEAGLSFAVADPVEVQGCVVSSSLIRDKLAMGEVRQAAQLLGRPHRLRGRVVEGAKRGRELGFPTANLSRIDVLVPGDGVYAGRAYLDSANRLAFPAAIHVGPNATFGESERTVEVHLIGFSDNLYGKTIEVDFWDKLRGTKKFARVDELLDQIKTDVDQTTAIDANE